MVTSGGSCFGKPAIQKPGLDDVHVWTIQLDAARADLREAAALLGDGERARAASFAFERDRLLYTLGRAALRRVLASYLQKRPADIGLQGGDFGKPELAPPLDSSNLQFNASGSGGLVMVAVALGRPVGIDVEQVRPMSDLGGVAELALSASERAAFATVDSADKLDFFYAAWTRKEAYLKARGEGLMRSPVLVECGALLGEHGEPIRDVDDPEAADRWRALAWEPARGYRAAVVAQAPLASIVFM